MQDFIVFLHLSALMVENTPETVSGSRSAKGIPAPPGVSDTRLPEWKHASMIRRKKRNLHPSGENYNLKDSGNKLYYLESSLRQTPDQTDLEERINQ